MVEVENQRLAGFCDATPIGDSNCFLTIQSGSGNRSNFVADNHRARLTSYLSRSDLAHQFH